MWAVKRLLEHSRATLADRVTTEPDNSPTAIQILAMDTRVPDDLIPAGADLFPDKLQEFPAGNRTSVGSRINRS